MNLKTITSFLMLLSYVGFTNSVCSQNNNTNTKTPLENIADEKTQVEKDWEHLNYIKNMFTSTYEEAEIVKKANVFEYLKYVDELKLNRNRLVEDFLNKYPNNSHYEKALRFFLSSPFRPLFIAENMPEDQSQFLLKFQRTSSSKEWAQARRALPIDEQAKERWLQYGNKLIEITLASNASIDRKLLVSMGLISRDYMLAKERYFCLPKEPMESDYWESIDTYYWASFRQRLYKLIDTYPNSERLSRYIPSFLNNLKQVSPKLARTYMKEFFIKTGNSSPLSDRLGVKALHKVLANNLEAEETLEKKSSEEPLEMVFTSMGGKEINLNNLRGKVVLIDFWSINCAPCLKEMPHLKSLYDKYRNQGFEVIGIVAHGDKAKELVEEIIKKKNATWPQRLDNGADALVSFHALYNITALPTVWLLDKEGKIVDRNARGERLEPLIRKYLGLEN
ncbi:TlpA family protein disulfide reductase [Flavivirga rizhaonensis]|uniref:TlpA family protein disulfide reductase n=1 Tax=Flavivirga rizhaonensis TaxID=2559571 RepID=A0A4S1DZ63_9FLAO|nr:TlpA disulfide reductase family protein [Flavivirga rizhaonensis]TGV03611.1 TlpA family protein disulfide reductase [Flavivirga rizhaonensis]